MIIVKLSGGLGNQMFQYAIGKSLSIQLDKTLYIDTNFLNYYPIHQNNTKRNYELNPFSITASTIEAKSGWEKYILRNKYLHQLYYKLFFLKHGLTNINDSNCSNIAKDSRHFYLDGAFQSEEYFKEIESSIRQEFRFKTEPNTSNKDILHKIENSESISVHIRRGDYTNNTNIGIYHICSLSYYESAIKYMVQQFENPIFFIFSDDIGWVKDNLHISYPAWYIDHNSGETSFEDLRLMSACKHNIIANSSFSWWGAWLNSNKNKIVISPNKWFSKNDTIKHIVPQSWLLINS